MFFDDSILDNAKEIDRIFDLALNLMYPTNMTENKHTCFKQEPKQKPKPSSNQPMFKNLPQPKTVLFREPATVVFWNDGTKTVAKCQDGDVYDKEKGLMTAILKKVYGKTLYDIMNKYVEDCGE